MIAHILSIGSELTFGVTIDTNAAWLSQRLAEQGIICSRHVTIADDRAEISRAILESVERANLLLITGGLGPTPDDVTREALADSMGVQLDFHQPCLNQIEAYFLARNRSMHEKNRQQAMIPRGATPIQNSCGTAPGILARIGMSDVFVMPGVPAEMKSMFERDVLPTLRRVSGGRTVRSNTLHTFGMSESEIGAKIADLMQRGRNPDIGTSASDLIISIRIHAGAPNADEAKRLIDADAGEIRHRLGAVLFGEGDETLQSAVGRLLTERKKSISTAESCTGGLIAKRLTDVSGSSVYMQQGYVTYSNEAKQRLLDVPAYLIEEHGAVSAEVAQSMAANCRRISETDYALSATGIAGPTGGSDEKPVGLVYIGLATPTETIVKELRLGTTLSREQVRDRTAKIALNLLRLTLLEAR